MSSTPISITGLLPNLVLPLLGSSDPLSTILLAGPALTPASAVITLLDGTTPTTALGTLSGLGLTAGTSPGTYLLNAASPALLQVALSHLQFTPAAGITQAPMLGLLVSSGTQSASALVGAAAPVVTGVTAAIAALVAGGPLAPLSGLLITDPSAIATSANVTLTVNGVPSSAGGTLSGAGLSALGNGLYTLAAPSLPALNAELNQMQFSPAAGVPGSTAATTLQVSLVGPAGPIALPPVALNIVDPPVLTGLSSVLVGNGVTGIAPFAGVNLSGIDASTPTELRIITSSNGVPGDANGVLSGTDLTETSAGSGTYTLDIIDPSQATPLLDGLTFTAAPSTVGTPTSTSITLQAVTIAGTVTLGLANLDTYATRPVISGLPLIETLDNTATITPFGSLSITDASNGASDAATITLNGSILNAAGTLSAGSLPAGALTSLGNGTYTLAATGPATLSGELDRLVFTPPAGATGATGITLRIGNAAGLSVTAGTTLDYGPPAPLPVPIISGLALQEAGQGTQAARPFGAVSVSDATAGASDSAAITLFVNGAASDASGSLAGAGLTETSVGVYALAATDPASLTAALDALRFVPAPSSVAATTTIALQVTNAAGLSAGAATMFTDQPGPPAVIADPPSITGLPAAETAGSSGSNTPFGSLNVTDGSTAASDAATITLSVNGTASALGGSLSAGGLPAGALTSLGHGVYSLAATNPAGLSSELEQLVFTPPGSAVGTTTLALHVSNAASLSADGATSLSYGTATPVQPPAPTSSTISGLPASETGSGTTTTRPFGAVTVADANTKAADSATITLTDGSVASDATGTLSGAGLTHTGFGAYSLAATDPGALSTELQALVFTPNGGAETTGIALDVTNAATLSVVGTTTLVYSTQVVPPPLPVAPSIAGLPASETTAGTSAITPFGSVTVTDASILASDAATITLSVNGTASALGGSLSAGGLPAGALTSLGQGVYSLAATTPAGLSSELDQLVFTPPGSALGTTTLALHVSNAAALTADAATALSYGSAVQPPAPIAATITGLPASETGSGTLTTRPFGAVTVADAAGATDGAVITLTDGGSASDVTGTLSGAGLAHTGAGTYALTATSPAALTAELQALVFTPSGTGTTGIAIDITNSTTLSTLAATTLVYSAAPAVNPSISGLPATETASSSGSITPFGSVSVTDGSTAASDTATITLSVNGTASSLAGSLSAGGLPAGVLTSLGNGVYSLAATSPAGLSGELDQLVFTPPGSTSGTTTLALHISNAASLSADAATALSYGGVGPVIAPVITGLPGQEAGQGTTVVRPFGSVTVSDATPLATESATITLLVNGVASDATGLLSGVGLTETATGVYALAATDPATLSAELNALRFTPPASGLGGTTTIDLQVTNNLSEGAAGDTTLVYQPTPVPPAPTAATITGLPSAETGSGGTAINPFGTVTVGDANAGAADSAVITLSSGQAASDATGTLTGAGLTHTGIGTYALAAATPASLTAALQALVFTPSGTGATGVALDVTNAAALQTIASTTLSYPAAPVPAPTISGLPAQESGTGTVVTHPFGSVAIADTSTGAADSATITLSDGGAPSDATGTLSGLGLTHTGAGAYSLAATDPATLSNELQALVFTPSGVGTTAIALDVANAGATPALAGTTLVYAAPATTLPVAPTISGLPATEAGTGTVTTHPFGSVAVNDTSPAAQDSATITLSNGGTPGNATGALSGYGLTQTAAGVYSIAAASPATLTGELQALVFTPNGVGSTAVELDVANLAYAATASTTVVYTSPPPPLVAPTITGLPAQESGSLTLASNLFGPVTIGDTSSAAADQATITLSLGAAASDAAGSLSGAGLSHTGAGTYVLAAASPSSLTAELQALAFTPSGAGTTGVSLAVANAGFSTIGTTAIVTAGPSTSSTPTITGLPATESGAGIAATQPFGSVTVTDASAGATDAAVITLSVAGVASNANGSLSGAGLTQGGAGSYMLVAATPATLTSELNALVFTPSGTGTTGIALQISNAATAATGFTTLTYPQVAAAPVITGLPTSETGTGTISLQPFSAVSVSDTTANASDGAVITLLVDSAPSDQSGTLAGAGLTHTGAGTYTLSATSPATLSSELQALVFTPAGNTATTNTGITLSVTNQANLHASATTSLTYPGSATRIFNSAPLISGVPDQETVAGTASTHPFGSVTVVDTSTNASESMNISLFHVNFTDADGELTGAGLIKTGTGFYRLAAASPQVLTAELQALVFTPLANTRTSLVLNDVNQAGEQAASVTLLTYTSASNVGVSTPVISGVAASAYGIDRNPTNPFGAVTVTDASASPSENAIIQIKRNSTSSSAGGGGLINTDAAGTLTGAGLVHIGAGLYSIGATSPEVLTAELQALVFMPTALDSTGIRLSVTNSSNLGATKVTVLNYSLDDSSGVDNAIVLAGLPGTETDTIGRTTHPFGAVSLTDASSAAADEILIRTLKGTALGDPPGTLSGLGLIHLDNGLYSLDYASPGAISAELQDIIFTPDANGIATFALEAINKTSGQAVAVSDLTVGAISSTTGPVIDGMPPSESDSGNTSLHPFGSVTITDASLDATDSVVIMTYPAGAVPGDDNGMLSGVGLTETAAGVYELAAASPAALSAELQALIFTPSNHNSTSIAIVATNQAGQSAEEGTYLNNSDQQASGSSPVISALPVTETAPGGTTVQPFGQVTVFDAGANRTISAAITVLVGNLESDANGTLALYGSGLIKTGTGLYTLSAGTPASLAAQLAQLAFTPTTSDASATSFIINVTDANNQTATGNTTLNYTQANGTPDAGHIFYWLSPSSFSVSSPPNYIVNGQLSTKAPDTGDVVAFATGSSTHYTVGSSGIAGSVLIRGDSVSMTGALTTSAPGLTATGADTYPGATNGLRVVAGGQLTLTSTASVTGGDSVVIGGAFTSGGPTSGGLVVNGTINEATGGVGNAGIGMVSVSGAAASWTSSGALSVGGGDTGLVVVNGGGSLAATTITLAQNSTLALDTTASLRGAVTLSGGTLEGIASTNQSPAVTIGNVVTLQSATTSTVDGSTMTVLTGPISGAGTLVVTGQVQLASGVNTGSATLIAQNATLSITSANAQGTNGIQTASGTSNMVSLYDGAAAVATTYVVSGGDDTIAAGSGSSLIAAGTGALNGLNTLKVTGGSGQLTVVGGSGSTVVLGTTGTVQAYTGSAGGYVQGGSDGGNVLIATGGATTLVGGGGGDLLFAAGSGSDVLFASGANQTLVGGGGVSELIGAGKGVLYGGGTGFAVLFGGSADTLVGGAGTSVLVTGNGDAAYGGNSAATVYGGTGSSTIYGGSGGASDVLVAGPGADTLYAGSGNDTLYGGANGSSLVGNATGSTLMIGRGGSNLFVGEAGVATVYGGQGSDTELTGPGTMTVVQGNGSNTTLFGSGLATVFGGTGVNVYDFKQGTSGGNDVISGFKVGQDQIALFGYGPGTAGVQATASSGGVTSVLLTDGTRITLLGVGSLAGNSIV